MTERILSACVLPICELKEGAEALPDLQMERDRECWGRWTDSRGGLEVGSPLRGDGSSLHPVPPSLCVFPGQLSEALIRADPFQDCL